MRDWAKRLNRFHACPCATKILPHFLKPGGDINLPVRARCQLTRMTALAISRNLARRLLGTFGLDDSSDRVQVSIGIKLAHLRRVHGSLDFSLSWRLDRLGQDRLDEVKQRRSKFLEGLADSLFVGKRNSTMTLLETTPSNRSPASRRRPS